MTTYKRPAWLRRALASVEAQTLQDLEVVVANNDAATANEVDEVVGGFGFTARVIHNADNLGQSASRNLAIEAARAPVVAFLDDDDWWEPAFLESHARIRHDEPDVGVVYCSHWIVWDGVDLAPRLARAQDPPSDVFKSMLSGEFTIGAQSVLTVRRDLMVRVGGYDSASHGYPDWDLLCRLARVGSFAAIPEPLATFRMHLSERATDPANRLRDLDYLRKKWADYPEIEGFIARAASREYYNASRMSALRGMRGLGWKHLLRFSMSRPPLEPKEIGSLVLLNILGTAGYVRLQRLRRHGPAPTGWKWL